MLFSGGHGGREPDHFPGLSDLRRSRRCSFTITQNRDFLRAIRNRVVLDISLYYIKGRAMQEGWKRLDSRFMILTERTFPYLETNGRVLCYIDLGYLLDPSWGPNFLVVPRRNLRCRFRPGPFDPRHPICLARVPWSLVRSPSPRQGYCPRADLTAEGEERD